MRIGPHHLRALPTMLLAATLAGPGASLCRAQAVGSLSEPVFQGQLERTASRPITARLSAMGGAYIAVDDINNLINLWRLDRNPAALIEDVQGNRLEIQGFRVRPTSSRGPGDSDAGRADNGFSTERVGQAIGQARWRNRFAAQAEVGYLAHDNTEDVSLGARREGEGNGPRLAMTLNNRIGRFYWGLSLSATNIDESTQFLYDTTYYNSVAVDRMVNNPALITDRVSYHSIQELLGLQYELFNGLRLGGTFALEQQRIDAASSNQRMQLDALNNRSLIKGSLGGTYRYRDKVIVAARYTHNSYDATETFRFSRRKKSAVQDPPVIYDGRVADHVYRTFSFDSRGTWRVHPKRLQLGFAYSTGKNELYKNVAVGPGSYNFLDSLYLASTPAGDSVGVSAAALVSDASRVEKYVRWGVGAQVHPSPVSTVTADYIRYTADLQVNGMGRSPETREIRVGGEYVFSGKLAVRAGYLMLKLDEDRNGTIDKRDGHQVTFGLGYTRDGKKSLELVYLTGNSKSDFADPSHLEIREQGLQLYGRMSF
ncbi:MAG: hypothetical protein HZB25_08275 [Candidatus Eisenbacteria bacterium]|nr:hypothetical protein [Candidatus Eisenbacteria bacterium]